MEEYLQATALEALCGYLYLQDRMERVMELLREGISRTDRRGKLGPRKIHSEDIEETGDYEDYE
jgi:hypothetical protein